MSCGGLGFELGVELGGGTRSSEARWSHTNRGAGEGGLRAGACLAQAEDVALLELPRDQPRTTHAQLEEDVASTAREVRAAHAVAVVPRLVVHDRVEPKAAVVPLVADVSAPTRKLRVRTRSRVSRGAQQSSPLPPPSGQGKSCVEERGERVRRAGVKARQVCRQTFQSRMNMDVVGVVEACCSGSSSGASLVLESALSVAPVSSTVYSCWRIRCALVRCDWYVCTLTLTQPR